MVCSQKSGFGVENGDKREALLHCTALKRFVKEKSHTNNVAWLESTEHLTLTLPVAVSEQVASAVGLP